MGWLKDLFKEEPKIQPADRHAAGINAILLGPPGSGKGTQVFKLNMKNGNIILSTCGFWVTFVLTVLMCIYKYIHHIYKSSLAAIRYNTYTYTIAYDLVKKKPILLILFLTLF